MLSELEILDYTALINRPSSDLFQRKLLTIFVLLRENS